MPVQVLSFYVFLLVFSYACCKYARAKYDLEEKDKLYETSLLNATLPGGDQICLVNIKHSRVIQALTRNRPASLAMDSLRTEDEFEYQFVFNAMGPLERTNIHHHR